MKYRQASRYGIGLGYNIAHIIQSGFTIDIEVNLY